MKPVIKTKNLTKKFGDVLAVDDVTLTVCKGEIYGFLGLNGAGKTTTIRMLLGMIRPTAGSVTLNGVIGESGNFPIWENVGYLVETPYAYPELTVRENLEIFRKLRRIPERSSVDRIMGLLNITSYANRKAMHLSLGNSQRLGLAKALIHNPSVLILDEPTNGLDPAGIVEIRQLLTELATSGVTVFISSHILGEISRIADRIGIIHEGRLLEESNANDLEKRRLRRLLIDADDRDLLKNALAASGINVDGYNENGTAYISNGELTGRPDYLCEKLVRSGIFPNTLHVEEEDLETYFLRIIGEKNRGKQ